MMSISLFLSGHHLGHAMLWCLLEIVAIAPGGSGLTLRGLAVHRSSEDLQRWRRGTEREYDGRARLILMP